jgi:hypothetical protein
MRNVVSIQAGAHLSGNGAAGQRENIKHGRSLWPSPHPDPLPSHRMGAEREQQRMFRQTLKVLPNATEIATLIPKKFLQCTVQMLENFEI